MTRESVSGSSINLNTTVPPVEIFCDFDGTVTTDDVIDRLLDELGDSSWKKLEAAYEAGKLGSREYMAQLAALIKGGWKAVQRVLDTAIQLEPSFTPFVKWCRDKRIPLHIVSDGFDQVINYLLSRQGVKVDSVFANQLVESADGSFSLQFPFSMPSCSSGVCKCSSMSSLQFTKPTRIVIGDGHSDFCWANKADLVFAKSKLLTYCAEKKLNYVAFKNFTAVADYVQKRLLPAEHIPAQPAAFDPAALQPGMGSPYFADTWSHT